MESNSHANKGFQAPSLNTKGDDKLFYGTQSWLKQPIQNRFSSCGVLLPQAIIASTRQINFKKKIKLCLKLDIYVRNIRKPQTTVNFSSDVWRQFPMAFLGPDSERFMRIYGMTFATISIPSLLCVLDWDKRLTWTPEKCRQSKKENKFSFVREATRKNT